MASSCLGAMNRLGHGGAPCPHKARRCGTPLSVFVYFCSSRCFVACSLAHGVSFLYSRVILCVCARLCVFVYLCILFDFTTLHNAFSPLTQSQSAAVESARPSTGGSLRPSLLSSTSSPSLPARPSTSSLTKPSPPRVVSLLTTDELDDILQAMEPQESAEDSEPRSLHVRYQVIHSNSR